MTVASKYNNLSSIGRKCAFSAACVFEKPSKTKQGPPANFSRELSIGSCEATKGGRLFVGLRRAAVSSLAQWVPHRRPRRDQFLSQCVQETVQVTASVLCPEASAKEDAKTKVEDDLLGLDANVVSSAPWDDLQICRVLGASQTQTSGLAALLGLPCSILFPRPAQAGQAAARRNLARSSCILM